MSYPQPSADQYAINGYQFFRLNTLLSSPGDIYQSEQSGHAFAIGPESDIANVNMAYFDSQAPTFMQQTAISPQRSFVGRIDSRNDAQYSPAGRPGVILFWADDLFDPNYKPVSKPATFNALTDAIQFVAPRLDVIEYFKPQESLVPARENKEFVFQNYPVTTGTFFLVIPYYGRKYGYVELTNRNQVDPNTFGIVGVNYAITQDGVPANAYHQETTLRAPAAVAPNGQATRIITAAADGMFDALVLSFSDAGPAPLRITVSDGGA